MFNDVFPNLQEYTDRFMFQSSEKRRDYWKSSTNSETWAGMQELVEVLYEGWLQRVFIDEMKEDGSEKWNKVRKNIEKRKILPVEKVDRLWIAVATRAREG